MEATELNPIQTEILKALEDLSEKATFTEFILAKKIRQNGKIRGNKKAGISLADLEKSVAVLASSKNIFYSIHVNSANDLILKKEAETKPMDMDAKKRRQSSEKSMSIFSNGDLSETSKSGKSTNSRKRTERKNLNVKQIHIEDFDDE